MTTAEKKAMSDRLAALMGVTDIRDATDRCRARTGVEYGTTVKQGQFFITKPAGRTSEVVSGAFARDQIVAALDAI